MRRDKKMKCRVVEEQKTAKNNKKQEIEKMQILAHSFSYCKKCTRKNIACGKAVLHFFFQFFYIFFILSFNFLLFEKISAVIALKSV